jgi:hypothetical protein
MIFAASLGLGFQSPPVVAMAEALRAIPALPLSNFHLPAQGQLGPQPFCPLCQARIAASEHLA